MFLQLLHTLTKTAYEPCIKGKGHACSSATYRDHQDCSPVGRCLHYEIEAHICIECVAAFACGAVPSVIVLVHTLLILQLVLEVPRACCPASTRHSCSSCCGLVTGDILSEWLLKAHIYLCRQQEHCHLATGCWIACITCATTLVQQLLILIALALGMRRSSSLSGGRRLHCFPHFTSATSCRLVRQHP